MATQDPQVIAAFLNFMLIGCGALLFVSLVFAVARLVADRSSRRRGRHARRQSSATRGERP